MMQNALPAAHATGQFAILRDLKKHFANGTVALKGIDLTIGQGEFVSLVGPSGCGKSTILRMLAGLAAPSSGSIAFPGEDGATGHTVGIVFQEATLMPWIDVVRNVMVPLRLAGMPTAAAERLARQALANVGLADFAGCYPRELSGGMKMRASIARAIVRRPKVLLLDEPFAALDELTRFNLNNDLLRLWSQERFTVVFVTHSVSEAVYLSQRVCVMAARPGRIVGEHAIDIPTEDRTADLRATVAFNRYVQTIAQQLSGGIIS